MKTKQLTDNNARVIAIAFCMALGVMALKAAGLANVVRMAPPVMAAAILTLSINIFLLARGFKTAAAKQNQH